jgi:hypothetical protein
MVRAIGQESKHLAEGAQHFRLAYDDVPYMLPDGTASWFTGAVVPHPDLL